MTFENILFVGCGNMGGAMLDGWLAGGFAPERFAILSPNRTEAPAGVRILREAPDERFDAVILGFKPHMLGDIAPGIQGVCGGNATVFSILAGTELATLAGHFPDAGRIVRLMPNLACALGKSPLGLVASEDDAATRAVIDRFVAPLGTPEWLEDEAQFDLVTALAGSGPSFVYRFIDALAGAAAELGLPQDQAQRLAVTMVEGAAALAAASDHAPAELARRVASPGGMTQRGLDVLDRDDALKSLLAECLRATRDRGREMAAEAAKNG